MIFGKVLLTKGLPTLAMMVPACFGIHLLKDHFENRLSRYDHALIRWLKVNGNDIVFSVTQGESTTDLSSFPDFSTNPVKIKVTVTADTSSQNIKGSSDNKLSEENNTPSQWTWICEMNFKRDNDSSSVNDIEETQKDKVFKTEQDKGLLNKLKKDISTTDNPKIREIKKDFIKKCGLARGKEKNKELNGKITNSEIKTEAKDITFELGIGGENKSWGTEAEKLYFKDKDLFNYWFETERSGE